MKIIPTYFSSSVIKGDERIADTFAFSADIPHNSLGQDLSHLLIYLPIILPGLGMSGRCFRNRHGSHLTMNGSSTAVMCDEIAKRHDQQLIGGLEEPGLVSYEGICSVPLMCIPLFSPGCLLYYTYLLNTMNECVK